MTISITQLPGCCTANVISGFGGSRTQHHGALTADQLKQEMALYAVNNWEYELGRQGVTIATLTTEQTTAIELLRGLGWTEVPQTYAKPKHPETELMVFTIQCQALLHWARDHKRTLDEAARAARVEAERLAEERRRNAPQRPQVPQAGVNAEGFSEDFEEEDF